MQPIGHQQEQEQYSSPSRPTTTSPAVMSIDSESPLVYMYVDTGMYARSDATLISLPSLTAGSPPHSLFTVFSSHTNENLHKTAEETGEEEGKRRQQKGRRYSNAYCKTREVSVPLFGRCLLKCQQQRGKKDNGSKHLLPHHNYNSSPPPPWCRFAVSLLIFLPLLFLLVCVLLLALSPSFRANEEGVVEEDASARASGSEVDSLVSILGLSPAISLSPSSSPPLLEPTASLNNNGVEVPPPYSPLAVMDVVLSDLYERNGMVPEALVHELREQRRQAMKRAAYSPLLSSSSSKGATNKRGVVSNEEEEKGSRPTRKRSRIPLGRYLLPQLQLHEQQNVSANEGGKQGSKDDSKQIHVLDDGPPSRKSKSGPKRAKSGDVYFSSLPEDLTERTVFKDRKSRPSRQHYDNLFGNSVESFVHSFSRVVKRKAGAPLAGDTEHSRTPLQSGDLPFIIPRQSIVYPSYKGSFNRNYKIVANFSDKICRKVTARYAGKASLNMNDGLKRSILPKCPISFLSDRRYDDAESSSSPGMHLPLFTSTKQRKQIPLVCSSSHAENGGAVMFNSSSWTNLRDDHLEAILLKILRLVLKNTGCDDLINGKSDLTVEEFFGPIRDEFLHEYTVLTVGSMSTTCGRADTFLASFFAGAGRVNILSLDYLPSGSEGFSSSSFDWSLPRTEDRTPHALLSSAFQPSSLHSCYVSPPSGAKHSGRSPTINTLTALDSLSFIGSDTFSSVIAFDSFLASVPNDLLCETVRALLRVTKIGGAVWVGHEADGERVRILSECRVEQCEGHTIEMSEIKESIFLSKMIEFPDHLLSEGSLRSFIWRKETSTFFEDISEFELGTRRKADRRRIDESGGQKAPLAGKAIDAEALALLFKGRQ